MNHGMFVNNIKNWMRIGDFCSYQFKSVILVFGEVGLKLLIIGRWLWWWSSS